VINADPALGVHLGLRNGQTADWNNFMGSYEGLNPQLSGLLHVDALVTPLIHVEHDPRPSTWEFDRTTMVAALFSSPEGFKKWRFSPTTKDYPSDKPQVLAVHITREFSKWADDYVMIVISSDSSGQTWKRIGFGIFKYYHDICYEKRELCIC
jgi:hypothetical protein